MNNEILAEIAKELHAIKIIGYVIVFALGMIAAKSSRK